ncbi:unnamed protein product [Lactuca saligna]|uniref:Uncharacterized protein n=1 Tax=Lactuca saligna TaxID=75948 RepID=A0AA35ZN54_LACSI|nr:unnamed protein product [Lactuca saligna]
MAHSLTHAVVPISTTTTPPSKNTSFRPSLCHIPRRDVALCLVGAVFGLSIVGDRSADAAARRPPPPTPTEKKDPNVSGVLAKVIASKKRKEAMKESIAQLRQKGKVINEPSTPTE